MKYQPLPILDERPRTRQDCPDGPCPFVSCAEHLIHLYGATRNANHQAQTVWEAGLSDEQIVDLLSEMPETCAARVMEDGPHSDYELADTLGITRAAVNQLYRVAVVKLIAPARRAGIAGAWPAEPINGWQTIEDGP